MNAEQLAGKLNSIIDDLDGVFSDEGVPRVISLRVISVCRMNGNMVTPNDVMEAGWVGNADKICGRLNSIAVKLDDLAPMSRARAVKLITGQHVVHDQMTGQAKSLTDTKFPPPLVSVEAVQEWMDNLEAAK